MGLWWGFSLPHTLSSLHFLKPHSKCVSEGDCVALGGGGGGGGSGSHVFSAQVSTEGRVVVVVEGGINRRGQAQVKLS